MHTVVFSTLLLSGLCSARDMGHRVLLQPPDPNRPPDITVTNDPQLTLPLPPVNLLNPTSDTTQTAQAASQNPTPQNNTSDCGALNQQCCRNPGKKYAKPYCNANGRRLVCKANATSQLVCVGCGYNGEPCCFRKSKLTGLSYVCQSGPNNRGACSRQGGEVKCEVYQLTALLPANNSNGSSSNGSFPFNVTVCVARDVRKQPNELRLTWTVTNTVSNNGSYVDNVEYASPVDKDHTQVDITDPGLLQGLLNNTVLQANWGIAAGEEEPDDIPVRRKAQVGSSSKRVTEGEQSGFWEFVLSSSTKWGLMLVTPAPQITNNRPRNNVTGQNDNITYQYNNINDTKVTVSSPEDLPNGSGKEFSAIVTLDGSITNDTPLVLGMAAKVYAINSSSSSGGGRGRADRGASVATAAAAAADGFPSPSYWALQSCEEGAADVGVDAFRRQCSWTIEL